MITSIAPSSGGVAHVARCVVGEWRAHGVAVHELVVDDDGTVTGGHGGTNADRAARRAVPIAFRAARAAWRHRRCCLASDQTFHVELGRTACGTFWFALFASLIRPKTPMVVVTHDIPVVVRHPSAALMPAGGHALTVFTYRVLVPLLDPLVLQLLRRRTSATVVLSDEAARAARRGRWPAVRTAVHGADAPSGTALDPGQATTVLLAGYIGKGKGLDVLARAWTRIGSSAPEMSLVIAGGGADPDDEWFRGLQAELDGCARPPAWLGYVPDEHFAELIANAGVVVLPYEASNPASGPLVRALVEGRAVVASRVPAVLDEVTDGVNGLLVEPGDDEQLAEALRRLMSDKGLRRTLGRTAGRLAAKHSWAAHVAVLSDVHAEALGLQRDAVSAGPIRQSTGDAA